MAKHIKKSEIPKVLSGKIEESSTSLILDRSDNPMAVLLVFPGMDEITKKRLTGLIEFNPKHAIELITKEIYK